MAICAAGMLRTGGSQVRSALFVIAIIGAAFLLIGLITTHGLRGATPHRPRPTSTHMTVCQPGPVPEC